MSILDSIIYDFDMACGPDPTDLQGLVLKTLYELQAENAVLKPQLDRACVAHVAVKNELATLREGIASSKMPPTPCAWKEIEAGQFTSGCGHLLRQWLDDFGDYNFRDEVLQFKFCPFCAQPITVGVLT